MNNNQRTSLLILVVIAFACLRLIPTAPNFTPIGALALFAGAHFKNRWMAFAVPLAALFLSDLYLGFHATMPFVYGAFALTTALGVLGQMSFENKNPALKALVLPLAGGFVASLLFFGITNFGVWYSDALYPMTGEGLAACFTSAIPFFRNTLASTWIYSFGIFGAFWLLDHKMNATQSQTAVSKN